jgi:hypothetical protein
LRQALDAHLLLEKNLNAFWLSHGGLIMQILSGGSVEVDRGQAHGSVLLRGEALAADEAGRQAVHAFMVAVMPAASVSVGVFRARRAEQQATVNVALTV